uniref:Ketoreductase domain-containing protein n=1 Tax=Anopheles farauti TaxID=69004 RepID=A0A182QHZ1_9DIPT
MAVHAFMVVLEEPKFDVEREARKFGVIDEIYVDPKQPTHVYVKYKQGDWNRVHPAAVEQLYSEIQPPLEEPPVEQRPVELQCLEIQQPLEESPVEQPPVELQSIDCSFLPVSAVRAHAFDVGESTGMDEIRKALVEADPFASWWPFVLAGIVFVIGTVRTYMGGQPCPNTNTVPGRVCVVTGATGGIGREVCRELVRRQVRHLVVACRQPEQGDALCAALRKEAPDCTYEVVPLDLRSFDSVRRFVRQVQNSHRTLDALVNCAGVIFPPGGRTADGFEQHLQCNFLSHFLLTQLLLPELSRSPHGGRIVHVSAHGYTAAKITDRDDPLNLQQPLGAGRDAFAHSKLAIVMAGRVLAKQLAREGSNVTINSCSPGLVRGTGHLRHSPIMQALFAKVITYPWMWLFMKNPAQGAHTIIRLVTDPALAASSGDFYNDCERVELTELAKDDELAERLFRAALRAVGLSDGQLRNELPEAQD